MNTTCNSACTSSEPFPVSFQDAGNDQPSGTSTGSEYGTIPERSDAATGSLPCSCQTEITNDDALQLQPEYKYNHHCHCQHDTNSCQQSTRTAAAVTTLHPLKRRQQQHHTTTTSNTITNTLNVTGAFNYSNALYFLGSCLYVALAIWDIHTEDNWYNNRNNTAVGLRTTTTTTGITTTLLSTDEPSHQHHKWFMWTKMDPYLFFSISAALCYVIDAVVLLGHVLIILLVMLITKHRGSTISHREDLLGDPPSPSTHVHIIQPTPPLPKSQCQDTDLNNTTQNCTITCSTSATNNHDKNSNCDGNHNNTVLFHRFEQQNLYMVVLVALSFGGGATFDLIAALMCELDTASYVVVAAAHCYLINALLILSSRNNNITHTSTNDRTTVQKITFIGDALFLMGSMVDVALSYFYIGRNESDIVWLYIYRGYLFSAILWWINAVLYISADCIRVPDDQQAIPSSVDGTMIMTMDATSTPYNSHIDTDDTQATNIAEHGTTSPVKLSNNYNEVLFPHFRLGVRPGTTHHHLTQRRENHKKDPLLLQQFDITENDDNDSLDSLFLHVVVVEPKSDSTLL
jgi:hypothetical protein